MIYDLAIIGGGPAGVAAGVYASRKRLKTIFLTGNFEGQSNVSEDVQNWIGTPSISGAELSKNLKDHLLHYAADVVDVRENNWVNDIKQIETEGQKVFEIKSKEDSKENIHQSKAVLLTTGSYRRKLKVPGAEQFENKGIVYCASCDGPLFAGLDVAVVGGGNAAFETAAQLLAYCSSVTLLNRSAEFRADPITVAKIQANSKAKLLTNSIVQEIKGDKFVSGIVYKNILTDEVTELSTKGVFVEIGLLPNSDFLKDLVKLNSHGQVIVDHQTQRASAEGVWAAGDVSDSLYHQNNIAAGDGVRALEDIYGYLHMK
jgi:NADH-dependent peroxiredoxin subunit F